MIGHQLEILILLLLPLMSQLRPRMRKMVGRVSYADPQILILQAVSWQLGRLQIHQELGLDLAGPENVWPLHF